MSTPKLKKRRPINPETGRVATYNRPGRIGTYDSSVPERAYKLCLLGLTDKELCVAFGISEQTLYNWQKAHPPLKRAIQSGKLEADAEIAHSAYHRARGYVCPETKAQWVDGDVTMPDGSVRRVGRWEYATVKKYYPPDTGAFTLWLKNRSKHNAEPWTDTSRTEISGRDGGPVPVQNKIDLSGVKTEDLEAAYRLAKAISGEKEDSE